MSNKMLRQQIAWDAARLMYLREETEYLRAKTKAARRICRGRVSLADLPTNCEIREQVQVLARLHEGPARLDRLVEMRVAALQMLRALRAFRPKLIGSTLTGHVRLDSDIDLHVFSDSLEPVTSVLAELGLNFETERKLVRKQGEERTYRHIHVYDQFRFELTIYDTAWTNYPFKSSITGKVMERASQPELEALLRREHPDLDLEEAVVDLETRPDRFLVYEALLLPLENVKQSPKYHPEGDALYHSLQVFDLARNEIPYDEEFLLAALLHDVGKAIDPDAHVHAGLEALYDFITPRTGWLIAHHMEGHMLREKSLGMRSRRRLEAHEDFDELMLLCECDKHGRQRGVVAPDVDEALDYLRELAQLCGE